MNNKNRNNAFVCIIVQFFVSNQAVEGDCDVVLDKVAGVLTVTAFKCNTEGKFFLFFFYFAAYERKHYCATCASTCPPLSPFDNM